MVNDPYTHWKTAFQRVRSELAALNVSTEDDFLSIGAHLGELSGQAGEVTSLASRTASMMHIREIEEDEATFQEILNRIGVHLSHSEEGLSASIVMLEAILKGLGLMDKPLSGFKSIVKRLKVLGVSTKIESARLVHGDNGFNTLADDVENLSGSIAAKSGGIMEKLSSLRQQIEDMLSRLVKQKEETKGQSEKIINGILEDMASLSQRRLSSSDVMSRIEEQSRSIAGDVSEIVSSLQFHDITRQQIEHVKEVIDEWLEQLDRLPDSNGNHADMGILADVCDLEIRQLLNSKADISKAVAVTIRHLVEISGRVRGISGEIAPFMCLTGDGNETFFSGLKRSVTSIIHSLSENRKAIEDLSTGIESVASTVKTLTAFVDEIEEIGAEIETIALNARIKAAHTGQEGAALGVLAEEIKNLSVHGRSQTTIISVALKDMGTLAIDLKTGSSDVRNLSIVETAEMVEKMNRLLESFGGFNDQVVSLLASLDAKTEQLASGIDDVIQKTTVQEKVEKVLGYAVSHLEDVAVRAREHFHGVRSETQKEYLKKLEQRYTMGKERDIHRDLWGGAGTGSTTDENVELF